jgi:hypothetical protein
MGPQIEKLQMANRLGTQIANPQIATFAEDPVIQQFL